MDGHDKLIYDCMLTGIINNSVVDLKIFIATTELLSKIPNAFESQDVSPVQVREFLKTNYSYHFNSKDLEQLHKDAYDQAHRTKILEEEVESTLKELECLKGFDKSMIKDVYKNLDLDRQRLLKAESTYDLVNNLRRAL